MRPFALLLCPLVLVSAAWAAEPSPEPEEEDDAKTILGIWQAAKGVKQGTPIPAAEIAGLKMELTKDYLSILEGGRQNSPAASVAYKLDKKSRPRGIDLTVDFGMKATIRGIYKIQKGELTVVFSDPDQARPKAFDEKGKTVLVLRKAKAKK